MMSADNPSVDRPRAKGQGVYKSGYLSIFSKGRSWKSWKRRWFLLTRTSLIFFKNEPRGPIDGSLAVGGIDLNSSGRVVPKPDKKQLTISFSDGRAFTLKMESLEEVDDWRDALEEAIAAAPSAALLLGLPHDGLFRHDVSEGGEKEGSAAVDGTAAGKERRVMRSLVTGRPVLLALEDIDGSPSFLEKALKFIETHGYKQEGILRVSADVELVERRVKEFEEGAVEFESTESAHVVGDCIKHVLRELPSAPIPPSGCTALLQAFRIEDGRAKMEAMRMAVQDTFPEPNRRLILRLLQMMCCVAKHETINRMSTQAVAACMAPLLFRPLMSGECSVGVAGGLGEEESEEAEILAATQAAGQANLMAIYLMENSDQIFTNEDGASPYRASRDTPWALDDDDDDDDEEEEEGVEADDVDELEGGGEDEEGKRSAMSSDKLTEAEDDETQILALEATRQDLRASLAKEVRANEMLKESLASRKKELADEKQKLKQEVARLRDTLEVQREANATLQTGLKGAAAQMELDSQIRAEVKEIEGMEKDVARLRTEIDTLHRQLAHAQQKQQQMTSGGGSGGGASAERRQKIEGLLALKLQLQAELERTMAMCMEEQQKNAELEERRRNDDPAAWEQAVAQQKAKLSQAQSSLESEMLRGKELRRKMQLAQQRAAAAAAAASSGTPPSSQDEGGGMGNEAGEGAQHGGRGGGRSGGHREHTGPGAGGQANADGVNPGTSNRALAELGTRLENFKKRRAVLMQQLSLLSTADAPSQGGVAKNAGAGRD